MMNIPSDRGSFSPDDISTWFWVIIEAADRDRERLDSILRKMSREDIIRFDREFQEAAIEMVEDPFISFMDEDTSEDGAQDVADYVVSQGEEYYSEVWEHPELIPAHIEPSANDTFSAVADNVFWDRFGESIPYDDD